MHHFAFKVKHLQHIEVFGGERKKSKLFRVLIFCFKAKKEKEKPVKKRRSVLESLSTTESSSEEEEEELEEKIIRGRKVMFCVFACML